MPYSNKKGYFHRGVYEVVNKEKYLGTENPKCRSSWEHRMAYWCDHNSKVVKWGFECVSIRYHNPLDEKNSVHQYYVDFYVEVIDKHGKLRKFLAEVKPKKEALPPKKPKRMTQRSAKRFKEEIRTYVRNRQKWDTAVKFCKHRGLEFRIITEDDLL